MRVTLMAAMMAAGLWLGQSRAEPDVIYVPTPQAVVDAMLDVAKVTAADVVYDLGSGDGRIVITAAKKYGARGVGIEIDPALIRKSNESAAAAGVAGRVRFVTQDLFTADIHEATVVTLYLLQSINERLRPKLVRELKPGTRIVSHVFNMGPEWPPERTIEVGPNRVFLWTIPSQAAKPPAAQTAGPRAAAPALSDEELTRVGEPLLTKVCSTSCHGPDRIDEMRRTRDDWSDQVRTMMLNGAQASEMQFAAIGQYLTRYYGVVAINTAPADELSAVVGFSAK